MFHKKVIIKKTYGVRKDEVLNLRAAFTNMYGDRGEDIAEFVFKKKEAFKEQIWIADGIKVSVYLVDEVPYFIKFHSSHLVEVDLNDQENEVLLVPTIFFLLKFRRILMNENEQNIIGEMGSKVVCHGSTSNFIISGAHLMIPGILSCTDTGKRIAFVFSLGDSYPYAVGYITANFKNGGKNGVGVHILHCYNDKLWMKFLDDYNRNYVVHESGLSIPPEFPSTGIRDGIENGSFASNSRESSIEEGPEVHSPASSIFSTQDERLNFALVETIKVLPLSSLPIDVNRFIALFHQNYPRCIDQASIDFKHTVYKKALNFLQTFDFIKIEEQSEGNYIIRDIKNRRKLIDEHDQRYSSFLRNEHIPAIERELRDFELKAVAESKIVYEQKLLSAVLKFKPQKSMNRGIAHVMLLGRDINDDILFPQLGSTPLPPLLLESVDKELDLAFGNSYDMKELKENFNNYIRKRSLIVQGKTTGSMPNVKLDGALRALCSGDVSELKKNEAEMMCFRQFTTMHEIVVQYQVKGLGSLLSSIPLKHIEKKGELPVVCVKIRTERKRIITIISNLEAVGFTLKYLASNWAVKFSTACRVVDPNASVKDADEKKGRKKPVEIHLQGNFMQQMKNHLQSDLGLLPCMVNVEK